MYQFGSYMYVCVCVYIYTHALSLSLSLSLWDIKKNTEILQEFLQYFTVIKRKILATWRMRHDWQKYEEDFHLLFPSASGK